MRKIEKAVRPHPDWDGEIMKDDMVIVSASTLGGRMPQFRRKRWHLSNVLKELHQDDELRKHIMDLVGDEYAELAAQKLEDFEYGPRDEDGNTPADRGTAAHDIMEKMLRGHAIAGKSDDKDMMIAQQLFDAYTALDLTPYLCEEFIFNPGTQTGGRVDNIGEATGDHHVIDFKSKDKKSARYYGANHYVQLGTYAGCTRVAAYDPVRIYAVAGRQYLVSPTEMQLTEALPPLSHQALVITAWPTGSEVRMIDLHVAPNITWHCAEVYEFLEYIEGRKTNKIIYKGGDNK